MSAIAHFTMKTASDLYEYCNKILYNSQSNSVNLPLNIITEFKHECSWFLIHFIQTAQQMCCDSEHQRSPRSAVEVTAKTSHVNHI